MNLFGVPIEGKLIVWVWALLLLLPTAVAGIANSNIVFLSLPIPKPLGLFTVFLPLITGVSTYGASVLVQRVSKKEQAHLTFLFLAVIGFQLIYETIVAILAITHIIPPSTLRCGLETKWEDLYKSQNDGAIRNIQDSMQCCGFNTVKDRAWPWATHDDSGHSVPSRCAKYNDRSSSCFADWRKAEQINAGLILFVAAAVFIIHVLSIISVLKNTAWTQPTWATEDSQIANGNIDNSVGVSSAQVIRRSEIPNSVEEYRDGLVEETPRYSQSTPYPSREVPRLVTPVNMSRD